MEWSFSYLLMYVGLFLMYFILFMCFMYDQPIILVSLMLGYTLLTVMMVSVTVSGLLGFCCFMAMISGVLVLISYCLALVPYSEDLSGKKKSSLGIWDNYHLSSYYKLYLIFAVLAFFLGSVYYLYSPDSIVSYFSFVCSLKCSADWLRACVLTSFYLLFSVVVSINICSKYSGALVTKKWNKKPIGFVKSGGRKTAE